MSFRSFIAGALLGLQLLGVADPVLERLDFPAAAVAVQEAEAGVPPASVEIIPSGDGVLYSRFPAGDASPGPGDECDTLSGWACVNLGTGGGSITQASSTALDFNTFGTSSIQNQKFTYITGGSGDVQLKFRIPDSYAGNLDPLASVGGGFREGLTNTSFFLQGFSPYAGSAAIQVNYGTSNLDFTNVNGAAGQSRPRWVCATYDESESVAKIHAGADGSAWSEVASVPRDFSSLYVVLFGQSKSTTAALQASIDNIDLDTGPGSIDCYTPGPGGGGGSAPSLVTQIPNQNLTEGIDFTPCFAGNFSEPDGDPVTYTADLPVGTGLSFNQGNACFSGAPDASDVSASPYQVEICAVDDDGQACDTSQFSVQESTGDTVNWNEGTAALNSRTCAQLGAGPGDTIVIKGDGSNNRAKLTLSNCTGTASSPIRVVNDTTENSPLTISGSGGFLFILDNVKHVIIDGTGKWDGAGSNGCGNRDNPDRMQAPPGTRYCGIRLRGTGTTPQGIKLNGNTSFVTFKGIEIDGSTGASIRIGFAMNDHGTSLPTGVTQLDCQNSVQDSNPNNDGLCDWREGIVIDDNYIHDVTTESVYMGANFGQGGDRDLPVRNVHIRYNYVVDSGYDALSIKSNIDDSTGRSSIHDNYVDGAGVSQDPASTGNSGACADAFEGGFVDFYNNVFKNCFGVGIYTNSVHRPAAYGPLTVGVWNNIIVRAGYPGNGKRCLNFTRQQNVDVEIRPTVFNNTCVEPTGGGIQVGSNISSCAVRDNIFAGTTQQRGIDAAQCSPQNNLQDDVADLNFVDDNENVGTEDYRLTSSSPARNAATAAPSTDFEGDARPQQGAPDQGADEYQP